MSNSAVPETKKVKKKGPIRFEYIVPTGIVFAFIFAYFFFFFESHLRKGAEFALTYAYGAEVNIDEIDINILGPSIVIGKIQVTDKDLPQRNLIQVGEIRFGLLWDALLRAKVVIDEAAIKEIQAYSPRKNPGRIIPPEAKKAGPSTFDKVEAMALNEAKSQYNENILGDLASLAGGTDANAQLENIQGELKTDIRMKELESLLQEKEAAWKKRIDDLPNKSEIDELVSEAKELKLDGKNPVETAKNLEKLNDLIKQTDKKIKNFRQASKDLKSDVSGFNSMIKDLEKLAAQDLKDLKSRMKIPQIDPSSLAQGIFGKLLAEKMAGLQKYLAMAQAYMPPKKSEAAEKKGSFTEPIVPKSRSEGHNYRFRITRGYPLFWLKKAEISSRHSPEIEYSGNFSGSLRDVTTDPAVINKPLIAEAVGDFPKLGFSVPTAHFKYDNRTDNTQADLELVVDRIPVGRQQLLSTPDVKVALTQSLGTVNTKAIYAGPEGKRSLKACFNNAFSQFSHEVEAKAPFVDEVLEGAFKSLDKITIETCAEGPLGSLNFTRFRSNLGDALQTALKKNVEEKLKALEAKLKSLVDDKVNAKKKELESKFNLSKKGIDDLLGSKEKELEAAKKMAEGQIKGQHKQGGDKKTKELDKAKKKLLKGLGL